MNPLRRILSLVSSHRYATTAALALVLGAVAFARWRAPLTDAVVTPPLEHGPVAQAVYGIGTVTAKRVFQLKLGMVGTLEALHVREGDQVAKGAKLATIERMPHRAPFAGIVTSIQYHEGENVPPQAAVLTLVDVADRDLVVQLEQQGALRIRRGQPARVSFDTRREVAFDGEVVAVYPSEGGFLARIAVAALPPEILPGMTADVAIEVERHQDSLLAPIAAVEGGKRVWVDRGGVAPVAVDVKTGFVDKALVEVVSADLKPGERLLIRRSLAP